MRTVFASAFLGLALIFAATPASPFSLSTLLGNQPHDRNLDTFKLIHVDQLAELMVDPTGNKLNIYDANLPTVRSQYGVIPGAVLLPSDNGYNLSELPQSKKATLVFYCANTQCMASHQAARRAVGAGYTDVNVMADGIMGWKAAGKPTVATASAKPAE